MRKLALALTLTVVAFVGCSTAPTSSTSPPAATAAIDLGTVAVNDGGAYNCTLSGGRECRICLRALADHQVLVEVVVSRKDAQGRVRILARPHNIANSGEKVSLEIDEGSVALIPEVKLGGNHNERPRTIDQAKPIAMKWNEELDRQARSAAEALQRFDGQADVRLTSQETNGIFGAYDQVIAGAVAKRWRELLAERSAAGPPVSVTLEFQAHSGGQVTHLRAVQSQGGEVFALIAQKAVLDLAPYPNWSGDMRRAHTNDYRILRLSFTFQEKAK